MSHWHDYATSSQLYGQLIGTDEKYSFALWSWLRGHPCSGGSQRLFFVSLPVRPDAWLLNLPVIWRRIINLTVLGPWQESSPPRWTCPIQQCILSGEAERTNCKIHPVPHKQSLHSDGEATEWGMLVLTQAFHICKEEGGGMHNSVN